MTLRRIVVDPTSQTEVCRWFLQACDLTFTRSWFGHALFPSTEAARKAWPEARRGVWVGTLRMRIPRAAQAFDGLSLTAPDVMRQVFGHVVFPSAEVVAAVAADRRALHAFVGKERQAARELADILAVLSSDLDRLEQDARSLAGVALTERSGGPVTWPSGTYGASL
jgi:hypothetical protein